MEGCLLDGAGHLKPLGLNKLWDPLGQLKLSDTLTLYRRPLAGPVGLGFGPISDSMGYKNYQPTVCLIAAILCAEL